MKLYVDHEFSSPWALVAHVGLSVKQVPFTLQTVNLTAGEQHRSGYEKASWSARVPMLEHEDFTLSESSAILEYLEDTQPGPHLFPTDVRAKAKARQLQAWIRSDFLALRQERSTRVVFYGDRAIQPLSPAAQTAADKLLRAAGQLIPHPDAHALGAWTVVDVDLALMLQRLLKNGESVPAVLAEYAERQWQHPAIRAWLGRVGAFSAA